MKNILSLLNQSFESPALNLAYEQFLFDSFEKETMRLWTNPTSVIVGKHQNAMKECNIQYCEQNNIPILRRISGGGTVYHDLGNVNFSFFRWVNREKMIDYKSGLDLVHKALNAMGYPVVMNERHDLYLNGFKISGNAQHLKKNRSLHHGTILYDANLELLRSSIKRTSGVFVDKAVASVRSPIANLRTYKDLGETGDFIQQLHAVLVDLGATPEAMRSVDRSNLRTIAQERYNDDSWNFGYSPSYDFINEIDNDRVNMQVERGGTINSIEITSLGVREHHVERLLLRSKHFYKTSLGILSIALKDNDQLKRWMNLLY